MRKARIVVIPSLFVLALAVFLPCVANAQSRDRFVISARAGGVNAVTGPATMRAHGNSEWQQLTIKEDLETGDVVKTGMDGRVEMLLNPGSYLRIGENSEFELTDSSLDSLEVRLIRGTAIVEATGADDTALLINITTPHTKLAIVQRGLYRLNVVPGDNTELIVRKGRVLLDRSHTKIKGGNKVIFNSDTFFIAKLDKAEKKKIDGMDVWSKDRADTLAQANSKIRNRDLNLLMSSFRNPWSGRFSSSFSGIWLLHPRYSCYTFVPFYLGWGSPYGASYSRAFYGYSYYGGFNNSGYRQGNVGGGVSSSSGGSTASGTGAASTGRGNPPSPRVTPVFRESRPIPGASQHRINRARGDQP